MMEEPSNLGHSQENSSAHHVPAPVSALAWNPTGALMIGDQPNPYINEVIQHSRDLINQTNEIIIHDQWPQNVQNYPLQELRRMKEENCDGSSLQLLLRTLSHDGFHLPVDDQFYDARESVALDGPVRGMRGIYSLVLPSETVSGSTSMVMQSPLLVGGVDHALACAKSNEDLDRLRMGSGAFRTAVEDNLHDIKKVVHEGREAKRGNSDLEGNKGNTALGHKRPRVEGRSSISPFKVRKEKLGDRIAALQQLVAPFGKTDTASVLMEAIGYIKFLQDQVETLSVPYMKSSRSNKSSHGVPSNQSEEPKMDLRSRGLCLVPLSCTSYVTNGNICIWPPNFNGGLQEKQPQQ